jgi:GT2 family glycosyltransferase
VDSGSTDGSVAFAQSQGVEGVELDLSIPFTAARARNTGFMRLLEQWPDLNYVQFVDGDCALMEGWCDRALALLQSDPSIAVVCGRRRERFPDASVFNALCDLEWNTPIGEALACGGDALMRIAALQKVGSYNPVLIAGEEPELCVRLRQQGWRILRIDQDMTWHDAQMLHLSQWWRRSVRGGHAYAEVSWLHRHDPEGFWRKESRRIWVWGAGIPLLSLTLLPITQCWSGLLGLLYLLLASPMQFIPCGVLWFILYPGKVSRIARAALVSLESGEGRSQFLN